MQRNAPASQSRLLDALDDSFKPTQPSNDDLTSNERVRALREALAKQAALSSSQSTTDTEFLSSSMGSSRRSIGRGAGRFSLNYDDATPIRSIDVGGPDQQQKLDEFVAQFVTSAINNVSHGLTVKSAMKSLGLKDEKDTVPGLEVRLLPHQLIGVTWMLDKEKSKDKGGILADDMGLGKTVQMIATMLLHMPDIDSEDCRSTLIVVPAALLQQWKEEIEQKTGGILTVHIHHGKEKLKKKSEIDSYDVIVTTYQTLNGDFATPKDVDPTEEAEWLSENGGILAQKRFYRVIADEAQYIRNRSTRSSISLAHVQAKYRWMLTGTPVTNTLADIYGLLRFGRFRPWNDWNDFNAHVARLQSEDAVLAGERAKQILRPILLRRTKGSMLEGKPILQLPPKDIAIINLKFSEEERELYNSFESRSKIRLSKFIRERTLVKNHAAVLVMILRLRQLCCHPNLILSLTDGYDDPTMLLAGEAEKELSRALKVQGRQWVNDVKKMFLLRARAEETLDFDDDEEGGEGGSSCPSCEDYLTNETGRILGCKHEMCFDCLLDMKHAPIAHNGEFGNGNEKENLAAEKKYEAAAAKGHRPCPMCKEMQDVSDSKVFRSIAFQPTDEELTKHAKRKRTLKRAAAHYEISDEEEEQKPLEERIASDSDDDLPDIASIMRPKKKAKLERDDDTLDLTINDISAPLQSSGKSSPAKRKTLNKAGDGPSEALIATWRKGDDDMEPSTKMLKLLSLLKEWDAGGDKTICYSQWTSMLDLLETLFSRYGIRSVRFDGKMDRASRDQTLQTFKVAGGPKVILISTKCGGVGLNLVTANRLVNMDLSWNYAAESQAYDRAHRIGQVKPVWVKRLVVENTIEERMLKLQDVKVGLAEAALGEGTGNKLHKLSVKDIKFLFNMNKDQSGAQPRDE
ncbi:SNF2 family DNA-dependent ATPase [Armillaria novae-zelandiae]|uniref:SNF2 family DNA-dependent ATPase n=1 Tax=Armillaria novae-zelandiae TaxID=153914 RepID=A0AA39PGZ6_9AGAR|nr:SNF2 family DNA-dependent ATPase [Armillaria novae-zelandiae]